MAESEFSFNHDAERRATLAEPFPDRFPVNEKEPLVADPSRHADNRNWLESLLRKIPGFKGYLEKEYRRESDQLARTLIANELKKAKAGLDNFQRALVDQGQLDALTACERLRSKLDLLQSRVQGAMKGYSGFFNFVRVDEGVLDQVYQLDLTLVDDVANLTGAIGKLTADQSPAAKALNPIQQQLDELARHFDQRAELLEGLT